MNDESKIINKESDNINFDEKSTKNINDKNTNSEELTNIYQ